MAEQLKEHIKDPGSAITHFIGMLMAIFAAIPLLIKAAREPSRDRKSTRLNSSHSGESRMPSSA